MMLYTGKGDGGTTTTFGKVNGEAREGALGYCDQRMSKSSAVAEALGVLDEANSYLGLCKVKAQNGTYRIGTIGVCDVVHEIQNDLFTVQAEVAGAEKSIMEKRVKWLENLIAEIEKELPEIKTFFISGGTELAARFDFARTLTRRAERRVVGVHDEGVQKVNEHTLAYLNRLSSLFYALARYANCQAGLTEDSPDYK